MIALLWSKQVIAHLYQLAHNECFFCLPEIRDKAYFIVDIVVIPKFIYLILA